MYTIHIHYPPLSVSQQTAKLVETGTFEEDKEVMFDDMVDEYDDEDEAIDAVRNKNCLINLILTVCLVPN